MTHPPMSVSPHYSSSLPSSHDVSAAHSFPVFSVFVFEGREERLVESGRKASFEEEQSWDMDVFWGKQRRGLTEGRKGKRVKMGKVPHFWAR